MKTIRTVKVLVKLAMRQIKRNDAITNTGLVFMFAFILPCLTAISINLVENGSNMM